MWKKWLFTLVIAFVLQVPLPSTLAEDASPGSGQPDIPHDTGVVQTGSNSTVMTYVSDTLLNLAQGPLNLLERIAAVPLALVERVIDWGIGVVWSVIEIVVIRVWGIVKEYVVPSMDKIFIRIAASETTPPRLKTLLMSFHSTYQFMQLFGYLKPT